MTNTQKAKKVLGVILILLWLVISFWALRHYYYKTKKRRLYNYDHLHFTHRVTVRDTSKTSYILISPYELFNFNFGEVIIMDNKGKVYYRKHTNGVVYGFRQWKINGHTRYSYMQFDNSGYQGRAGLSSGNVFILDSMLNTIKEIHLINHGNISIENKKMLDLHDFIMLSDDHFITMAHYEKTVQNIPDSIKHLPQTIFAVPIVQEIFHDSVIWQWDASQYPGFYAASREQNTYTDTTRSLDYMHLNSMKIDPVDSNIILSFRHLDQIVKVGRKTGKILWKLGGVDSDFPLTKEQYFLRQHDAKFLDDKTLIFIDNGDSTLRQKSRILEFRLDEQNKKVLSFNAFDIPEPYIRWMGSIDKIGDEYFICGGSANYILKVNYKTGDKKLEVKTNLSLYRAQLVDSIYLPHQTIKLHRYDH